MTSGLVLGIIAAFFWSLTNIIDKYLVTKYANDGNIGGVLLLSCFFPIILAFLAFVVSKNIYFAIQETFYLLTSGFLMVAWIYFYLKALVEDDTSVVMTLLVLAPLFSLFFAAFILNEVPTIFEILAGGLIVCGALVVSYAPAERGIKLPLLIYAVGASTVMGLMHTLFKFVTISEDFWNSMFWRSVGMILCGIILFVFVKSYQKAFKEFIKRYLKQGLLLNSTNESLTLLGDTIFAFAILFAPLALVQTTESYQPVFILLLVLILSRLGIKFVEEDFNPKRLPFKVVGILLTLAGSSLLIL